MIRHRTLNDRVKSPAGTGTKQQSMSSAHSRSLWPLAVAVVLLVALGLPGCSTENDRPRNRPASDEQALASDLPSPLPPADSSEGMDYDPWESFNEKTFSFNFDDLDHYAIKPAAKVWSRVLPEPVRQSLANAFYNLAMPKRFVNKVMQGRLPGAGVELVRFVVNSSVGFAGFFDVASRLGLEKSDADAGQTFGVWGLRPGPYLVLPLLPPLTVRDTVGFAADSFMDPLSFFVTPLGADIGRAAASRINERAENMALYQDVEDTSLDLYAAVRNGYLQRRSKSVGDAIRDRDRVWERIANHFESREKSLDGVDAGADTQLTR
jgi:phospholipid-binding lipoprotein MlaA